MKPMSFVLRKTIPSFLLILCLFLTSQHPSNGFLQDHTSFVFEDCSTHKLDDDPNGEYARARSMLLQKFEFQSMQSKFNRSLVMVRDRLTDSVSGVFQCRGDLDDHKCNECMKAARNVSRGLCGNSMAARIQLSGCHVQYKLEADDDGHKELPPADDHVIHHKICGELQAIVAHELFVEVRSKAFEALEAEIGEESIGHHLGFYSIELEGMHAIAQCDVGIGGCECAKCVFDAVHVAEEECPDSLSGQVFLELCYLSFEYVPHEIHGGAAEVPVHPAGKKLLFGIISAKLAALAVGGAVLLLTACLCCHFLRKKKEDDL